MSTWAARYVRVKDRGSDVERLRAKIGDSGAQLSYDGTGAFAMIVVPSPALAPDDLGELSNDFGEAISIQGQTVADLVVYDHWKQGARARGLTYAGEAGWIRVVGEPEPWEAAHFFHPARLGELLAELEEELDDADSLAREKAELETMWKSARLEEGSTVPHAEINAMTRAIVKQYALPIPPNRPSTTKQRAAG